MNKPKRCKSVTKQGKKCSRKAVNIDGILLEYCSQHYDLVYNNKNSSKYIKISCEIDDFICKDLFLNLLSYLSRKEVPKLCLVSKRFYTIITNHVFTI